jgi:hypothetical protein
VKEVPVVDLQWPLTEPHPEDRALVLEFPIQGLLEIVEHAEGTPVDLQPPLSGGPRVPGDVRFALAAERERHPADGKVGRAQ